METQNLRIAIQKSGRLADSTLQLFDECGISFPQNNNRLISLCYNFPMEILFLRDDDIPASVASGVADVGIVGENVVMEKEKTVAIAERLGFAKCRLSLGVPQAMEYQGIASLSGKRIATSYPRILARFLEENKVQAEIHEISGSVEIAPGIGLADAICDIVSSGSTLLANGLREVQTVVKSEALLISQPELSAAKQVILDRLIYRIKSVRRAKKFKYIIMNAPQSAVPVISGILPGMKSPTVTPLAESGWVSVHSVVEEDDFWEKIEQLREAGAQGILVIPIEKMML
jgi:ATP phosphoribosyltransferase